ncbi:glycosyltransferase [Synechococcus sp. CBW1002]|uniref:glycosyltransferase n=1 Tax=Synechococcus sp. CBW1002 TaxID=1353134 RepID=UPI0018CF0EEE|nr:glycosyltransferase [Synechococcus sp. CBW1002]QPN59121.1 glycosyltransferase [Synechococcus sp. CBW1002]
MLILLLRHYPLVEGPSMRAFADQIASGLRARGHTVQELTAPVRLARLARHQSTLGKWLGYLDQFVLFLPLLWWRARLLPLGSLCVFVDQALGPWIPPLQRRAHLVHVHDLLALEAALGRQPFHRLGWSGRLYQRWIRRGFRQARCFLSVSQATRSALEHQLQHRPLLSDVVYNPLQGRFRPLPAAEAAAAVAKVLPNLGTQQPFLFHIGCTWYKNRLGLLVIWEQVRLLRADHHLVLVGAPDAVMHTWLRDRPELAASLHVLERASDELVVAHYNRATALLFPSHAEGFGWPILEAMACGCPVITTDRVPMREVGGDAVNLIRPCPSQASELRAWAQEAAQHVLAVLQRSPAEQQRAREQGLRQAKRFDHGQWLDQLEAHYQRALALQEQP